MCGVEMAWAGVGIQNALFRLLMSYVCARVDICCCLLIFLEVCVRELTFVAVS